MRVLHSHHITNLVSVIDSFLPRQTVCPKGGRPVVLHINETIALLLFSSFVAPQRTIKGVYTWAQTYYYRRFRLPSYKSFVRKCHQALPGMCFVLDKLLIKDAQLRFMDSTMLHVCKLIRADRHKVAKGIAGFGKNWQGWHYGFKLHASIDHNNRLAAIVFTPASEHDNQHMERLVNENTRILVGDSHYGGSVMRKRLWKKYKTIVIAPPHHTQKKKIAADWQMQLLHMRPKIEATFGKLKEQHFLVTSFPRSVKGYFVHYIRMLLGYQMGANS